MKNYFKQKIWLIITTMFFIALGLSLAMVVYEFGSKKNIKILSAAVSDNVSGWAWNSNIGWISFNCSGENPPCSTSNYGVHIDPLSGNFSGYAWSPNAGWISFNRSDTGDPPDQPYRNGSILAHYDYNSQTQTNEVSGWAKILSLGDNGWVKLRKFSSDLGSDYGVSFDSAGDFSGWAWNNNDSGGGGIGWISFNCSNDSSCSASNYKVNVDINYPPTATGLTAPNWSFSEAGQFGAVNAKLGWTFSDSNAGSSQSAYQVIVNTQNNTDTPIFDSGKCLDFNNPTNKCKAGHGPTGTTLFPLAAADGLNYDTTYYWWVKVWDEHDAASDLTQYNTNPDTPLEANDGPNNKTFTTYKHEFPRPGASWFVANPSRGEEVSFSATSSQRFFTASPAAPVVCQNNTCGWQWTAANAAITPSNASTTVIIFNSSGSNVVTLVVTLRVTDVTDTGATAYYGEISIPIDINAQLPQWKEVKPE